MSDYMFMLESHLSADQFRVVGQLQGLATQAGINLFLTGGAMRRRAAGRAERMGVRVSRTRDSRAVRASSDVLVSRLQEQA